jgi:uncharacterized phage protein (predicted DNA packaging)
MATIPLSLLKKHVRADDFDTDDEKLQLYLDAAEEQVVLATNRTADELMEMGGGALPPSIVQAVMLMAGSWYDNAEGTQGVQQHEVPFGVSALVKPFVRIRRYKEGDEE